MDIQQICDWIILLGAVITASINIYKFIKKPAEKLQEKNRKLMDSIVSKSLDDKMPKILEENNKIIREELFTDIRSSVLNEINKDIEEIHEQNNQQTEDISTLTAASKDVLRQRIMTIYHTYKSKKALPIYEEEALDELYKDYKSEKGNSYIDKYYGRMKDWPIMEDEYEY